MYYQVQSCQKQYQKCFFMKGKLLTNVYSFTNKSRF